MKRILLVNSAATRAHNEYLRDLQSKGCRFYGLNRVVTTTDWTVHLDGEVALKLGTRSPGHAYEACKRIRALKIDEAVIFSGRENLKGREQIKFLMLLAGVSVKGVGPTGNSRTFSKKESIVWFFKQVTLLNWFSRKLDLVARAIFFANLLAVSARRDETPPGDKERLSVLILTNTLGVGGIEICIRDLVKGLDDKRYAPTVAILDGFGRTAEEITDMGCKVTMLDEDKGSYKFIIELARHLKMTRPDILHYHGHNVESIPVRLAAVLAGVPLILSHIHGTLEFNMGRWKNGSYFGFLTMRTWRFIACSEAVKHFVMDRFGYPEKKTATVYNGVDTEMFKPGPDKREARKRYGLPDTGKVLCVAARLVPEKGHHTLIEALGLVGGRREFCCLVCGEGPAESRLREMVKKLDLEERVLFMGVRDDLPDVLDAADVSVLPSSAFEGLPLSILEAMAKGLPVIATAVGGAPEIILDGYNGYIVPPEDPRALADALETVLADDGLIEHMGKNARRDAVEKYSSEAFVRNISGIYEEGWSGRHDAN